MMICERKAPVADEACESLFPYQFARRLTLGQLKGKAAPVGQRRQRRHKNLNMMRKFHKLERTVGCSIQRTARTWGRLLEVQTLRLPSASFAAMPVEVASTLQARKATQWHEYNRRGSFSDAPSCATMIQLR